MATLERWHAITHVLSGINHCNRRRPLLGSRCDEGRDGTRYPWGMPRDLLSGVRWVPLARPEEDAPNFKLNFEIYSRVRERAGALSFSGAKRAQKDPQPRLSRRFV